MHAGPLIEGALLIALTVILFAGGVYIPLVGLILSLFSPVPLVVLSMRYGLKRGIGSSLIASFLILLVTGPFQAFLFLFNSAVIAIAVGYLVGRGFKAGEVVFYGALVSLLSKIIFFAISALIVGINPLELNLKLIQDALKSSMDLYERLGLLPKGSHPFNESLESFLSYLRVVFPAVIIVASAFDAFLTFVVSGWVLRRVDGYFPSLPPFSEWRLPRSIFWGIGVGVLLSVLGESFSNVYLSHAGANLQLVFGFLLLIQGASLIDHFMKRFKFNNAIRYVLIFLIFMQPLLSRVVMLIGMIDILIDFRRRGIK